MWRWPAGTASPWSPFRSTWRRPSAGPGIRRVAVGAATPTGPSPPRSSPPNSASGRRCEMRSARTASMPSTGSTTFPSAWSTRNSSTCRPRCGASKTTPCLWSSASTSATSRGPVGPPSWAPGWPPLQPRPRRPASPACGSWTTSCRFPASAATGTRCPAVGPGSPAFEGDVIKVPEAICYPRPLQEHVPLLVGGSGERRTLRLAARYADACNLHEDPATVHHKVAVLHRHCADVDRDPAEVRVTHRSTVLVTEGAATAGRLPPRTLAGSVDDHVGHFRELAEAGVETAMVRLVDLGDVGPIERFAPVIKAFRHGVPARSHGVPARSHGG